MTRIGVNARWLYARFRRGKSTAIALSSAFGKKRKKKKTIKRRVNERNIRQDHTLKRRRSPSIATGIGDASEDALSGRARTPPNTFSSPRESGTTGRAAACRPGHYTGSEGSRSRGSFSFLSAIGGNYTLYSLVLRGTPAIIALRFCSAIRKTITRNRVPERISSAGHDPLKRTTLACLGLDASFGHKTLLRTLAPGFDPRLYIPFGLLE